MPCRHSDAKAGFPWEPGGYVQWSELSGGFGGGFVRVIGAVSLGVPPGGQTGTCAPPPRHAVPARTARASAFGGGRQLSQVNSSPVPLEVFEHIESVLVLDENPSALAQDDADNVGVRVGKTVKDCDDSL